RSISFWLNFGKDFFLSSIPTVFIEMAKFVHFIREKSAKISPTFNHTPRLEGRYLLLDVPACLW
ncbi:MAG: hypothetical protein ACO1QB_05125, partial [Verrucomicrobiales bacterium]